MDSLRQQLDDWFSRVRRPFPWRKNPTPYAVLVSEVMLQQTQASRVLSFFQKWMDLFPTLEALSQAPEEVVIKAWEGLGYYSRARSLQKAAKVFIAEYNGIIPQNKETLLQIPGIGPYTAGAILSFAFHQKAPAIDANVDRVIRRLHKISYLNKEGKKQIEAYVDALLPNDAPWHTMEALIELGALVCQKKPFCDKCPIAEFCLSHREKYIESPPPRKQTTHLFRDVVCIVSKGHVLIEQRMGKEIMSGLHEFPYFESEKEGRSKQELTAFLQEHLNTPFSLQEKLPATSHSFTRFRSFLYPWIVHSEEQFFWPKGTWVSLDQLEKLPFSSGHKRICSLLLESNA